MESAIVHKKDMHPLFMLCGAIVLSKLIKFFVETLSSHVSLDGFIPWSDLMIFWIHSSPHPLLQIKLPLLMEMWILLVGDTFRNGKEEFNLQLDSNIISRVTKNSFHCCRICN